MILIIEDNEIVGLWYENALGSAKIAYRIAKTGKEAIRIYQQTHIDMVVCDFHLPDMDGLDLCKKLRCLELERHVPMIIVSADEAEETENNAIPKMFDGWLKKPLTMQKLEEFLKLIKIDSDKRV